MGFSIFTTISPENNNINHFTPTKILLPSFYLFTFIAPHTKRAAATFNFHNISQYRIQRIHQQCDDLYKNISVYSIIMHILLKSTKFLWNSHFHTEKPNGFLLIIIQQKQQNSTSSLSIHVTSIRIQSTQHKTHSLYPSIYPSLLSIFVLLSTYSFKYHLHHHSSLSLHSLSQTHIITNYKWIFSSKLFSTLVFHQLCYIDDYDVLLYTVSQTNKDFIRRTPQ